MRVIARHLAFERISSGESQNFGGGIDHHPRFEREQIENASAQNALRDRARHDEGASRANIGHP